MDFPLQIGNMSIRLAEYRLPHASTALPFSGLGGGQFPHPQQIHCDRGNSQTNDCHCSDGPVFKETIIHESALQLKGCVGEGAGGESSLVGSYKICIRREKS